MRQSLPNLMSNFTVVISAWQKKAKHFFVLLLDLLFLLLE